MDMQTSVPAAPVGRIFPFKAAGVDLQIDLAQIPNETRENLLKSAVQSFVANRVATAQSTAKAKNAAWAQYEAAMANDPLQTTVPQPTEPKMALDIGQQAVTAINALIEGKFQRRDGTAPKKEKERKDPVITAITRAVTQEIFQKRKELDSNYKYPLAAKEVGADGLAYLRNKTAAWVAGGQHTQAEVDKWIDQNYVKPARQMLGLDKPKAFEGFDLLA